MKDGWLITSREVFCSGTHLQHLEEDTANQDEADNIKSFTGPLTLWQHRRKTGHRRWLTASGKAQWMGWCSSGSPPPAYFCQNAEPPVTDQTRTRQRVEGSPTSTQMCSTVLVKHRNKVKTDRNQDLFDDFTHKLQYQKKKHCDWR